MTTSARRRRWLRHAGPLLAATLFVAAPAPQHAAPAGCGENAGPLCRKNVSCIWIIFFKQCTEKYDYYPAKM